MTKLKVVPSTSLRDQIEAAHQAAIGAVRSGIAHSIHCGQLLLEQKAAVRDGGRGRWGRWVKANLSFGIRQEQRYRQLAKEADQLSNASPGVAFTSINKALAAASTNKALAALCTAACEDLEDRDDPDDPDDLEDRDDLEDDPSPALPAARREIRYQQSSPEEEDVHHLAAYAAYVKPAEPLEQVSVYGSPPDTITPADVVSITPDMGPQGLRAISLFKQGLRCLEADGFSLALREQAADLIHATEDELANRPLRLPAGKG